MMNACESCETDAQKAPPRLPWRGSASTRRSSKNASRHRLDVAREARERVPDDGARLVVGERAALVERRVLVGQVQLRHAQQLGLAAVPAVRDRVARLDRRHHRVDRRVLELVGEVALRHRRRRSCAAGRRPGGRRRASRSSARAPASAARARRTASPACACAAAGRSSTCSRAARRSCGRARRRRGRTTPSRSRRSARTGSATPSGRPASARPRRAPRPRTACAACTCGGCAGDGGRAPPRARDASASARSSSSAIHSSSKKRSVLRDLHVLLLDHGLEVARLVVVDVDGAPQADVRAGAGDGVVDLGDLGQRGGQAGGVELGDAAAVALGEGVAGGAGLVGQRAGGLGVGDDAGEVPAHALRARAGGCDCGHRPEA